MTDIVDLGQLGLKPGGGIRFEASVPVGDFKFSDERYSLSEDPATVTVDIARTSSGYVIRARLTDAIEGPCMRCYGDYSLALAIDQSEVHEPHLDEELASDYVTGQDFDLASFVRDAISLALPTSISSPVDENGVCIECEHSEEQLAKLRDTDETAEEKPQLDPRWAKLRELEL